MRSLRSGSVLLTLALAGAAACATADPGGGGGGDDDPMSPDADPTMPDAPPVDPDAPPVEPDAPVTPMARTLSQSTVETTITSGHTLVCSSNTNDVPQYTLANQFYRVFPLSEMGVTGQFTATQVVFAVESADTVAGSQTVQVKLHTIPTAPAAGAATFNAADLTQLYGQNVTVADMTLQNVTVNLTTPVVVPAGSNLVVELAAPAHAAAGNFFYPGSNASGESRPSYIMASECGVNAPTRYANVTSPDPQVHLILTVSGTVP